MNDDNTPLDDENENSEKALKEAEIPVSIKDDFQEFEDVPREDSDSKFRSPAEVMESTKLKSTEIADDLPDDEAQRLQALEGELNQAWKVDSGLNSFLDQLNITRSQFYYFLAFLLGLIVLIVISFVFLFRYFGTSEEQIKVIGNVEKVEVQQVEKEPEIGGFQKLKERFFPVKEAKDPEKVVEKAIEEKQSAVVAVGETKVSQIESSALNLTRKLMLAEVKGSRLSYYVRTYRQVRNIFNIELLNYLSQVVDRKEGFNAYLTQFKGANEQAKLAYEELRQEIEQLDLRVKRFREDTVIVENQFFDSLDNLESEFIDERLLAFQEVSRRRDLAIAELKARQSIAEIYRKALPLIATKIQAIELNRDPFIKGVQVVDYKQVDLDLILKER